MSVPPLPSIEELNLLSPAEAIAQIRVLFEAAPNLEKYLISQRPWKSYEQVIDLADHFCQQLLAQRCYDDVLSVLNAHPAIGADPAKLSADSRLEQGAAASAEVLESLAQLNAAYEKKFGFRFVVFVNGRPKDVILGVLKERMNNPREAEMQTAASAMMSIARDRLQKRKSKI